MADFKNGMTAVQFVKDLLHPPRYPSSHIYKASDAFAPYADKNIVVGVTQADRTIAQPSGRLKGGPLFSMLGEVDPTYKGKVWGHDSAGHAQGLLNGFEANPADTMLMTTILGGPLMQGSNSEIFKRTSKAYRDAIADNKLLPAHLKKTNEVVQGMTDKKGGVNLFDPDSDVTDPAFWKGLSTFQQRRAMNDIMGGYGVGGPQSGGAIFDWQKIMDKTTEPIVRDVPTRSVGPRIWTLDGGKEYSPHLNKAYPDIVTGVDQNINFSPVPYQDFLKDFTDNFMQTKNRVPNWKNLTMGHPKTQEITDQWLQHLKNTGNAEGGLIKGMADGGTPPAASMDGDQFIQAAMKAGLSTDIGSLNKIVDLVNKGMSISEAIEALTGQTHKRDGGQVEHMQHGGIMPRAGVYYPTSSDERSQAAGLPADFYRKGMTDVASHGYHAGVDVPAGDARLTADLMGSRYVSPQMTRDSINALRLGAEFPVGEGMLRAEVMKGLAPNVPTNVGLRYSRPFAEGGSVEHMQAGGIKKGYNVLEDIAQILSKSRSPVLPKYHETPEFKQWFKESPVTTSEGNPLTVYHGGAGDVTAFDASKGKKTEANTTGASFGDTSFTDNPALASSYAMRAGRTGANVIPAHLSMQNPYIIDNAGSHWKALPAPAEMTYFSPKYGQNITAKKGDMIDINQLSRWARENGHDGLIVKNVSDPAYRKDEKLGPTNTYITFEPTQAKSIFNSGAWSPDDPHISKAEGGKVEHMQAGGLKTLIGEVLNKGGTYAARRLERAADEIPNLEKLFQEQALKSAFLGDNARAVMTMKPSEFERFAMPLGDLSPRSSNNIVDLIGIKDNGGYADVPFLEINKKIQGSTGLPWVSGHEGRHRSRAMDQAGEQAGLVQFLPRAELREPFPRRTQEQYIDAIRQEMALTGNRVKPQKYYDPAKERDIQRSPIDLPDLYAEGGVAHKQGGGAMGLIEKIMAQQAAHNATRLAKTTRNIPPAQDMVISQAEKEANLARYLENAAVKDRMYHATGDDFSVVDVNKSDPRSKFGTGFYMTPNTNYANFFGNLRSKEGKPSQVMPVYSSVQNPYEISGTQNIPLNGIDREKLKALGHDGVLFRNDAGKVQEVVAFEPTQVKSAIGNRGTYDPAEVEMTKADGGAVHSQIGGMTPEPAGGSARQETFAAQHMDEGGDIMRSLFDHALDKGDIHEMTHAMLVKQHEAEHG